MGPNRPIKLIVPFAPGGSNDTIGGAVAGGKEAGWPGFGKPIIVDNRGGGGGTIGTDLVAKGPPPDGYTLLLVSTSITTNAAAGQSSFPTTRSTISSRSAKVAAFAVCDRRVQ